MCSIQVPFTPYSPEPHISRQTNQFVECDMWICTTRGLPWKGLTTKSQPLFQSEKIFLADEILLIISLPVVLENNLPCEPYFLGYLCKNLQQFVKVVNEAYIGQEHIGTCSLTEIVHARIKVNLLLV